MRYIFSLTLSEIQFIPTTMSQSMQHRATHTMSFSEHTQSTKRENSEKMFEINISTQVGNPPVQHFVSSLLGAAIHFFFIPAKLSGTHFHTVWTTQNHQHNHHHQHHHHHQHQHHRHDREAGRALGACVRSLVNRGCRSALIDCLKLPFLIFP